MLTWQSDEQEKEFWQILLAYSQEYEWVYLMLPCNEVSIVDPIMEKITSPDFIRRLTKCQGMNIVPQHLYIPYIKIEALMRQEDRKRADLEWALKPDIGPRIEFRLRMVPVFEYD